MAAAFCKRVKPTVDQTVRRLLGRLDGDVEDVVQVALEQLIESLPRYRRECPFNVWVSAVAANVVHKHIRRRQLERTIFAATIEDVGLPQDTQVTATVERLECRDAVRRMATHLVAMSKDRARVFVLHDIYGFSLDDVSRTCRISVTAAQSRLVRGRRDLHGRVAEDLELSDCLNRSGL